MISDSHSLRKDSLSKVGSIFTISVSVAESSVLLNTPPKISCTCVGSH